MNTIDTIYEKLDQLYAENNLEEIERFLIREANIAQPCCGGFNPVYITIMNELGSFYRNTGKLDLAVSWFTKSKFIVFSSIGEKTVEYATTIGNLADTYRMAGEYDKSLPLFQQALQIYEDTIGTQNYMYAAALNNLSLCYEAQEDYQKAVESAEKALGIIKTLSGASQETATTYSNLAGLYCKLGLNDKAREAEQNARKIIHSQDKL